MLNPEINTAACELSSAVQAGSTSIQWRQILGVLEACTSCLTLQPGIACLTLVYVILFRKLITSHMTLLCSPLRQIRGFHICLDALGLFQRANKILT